MCIRDSDRVKTFVTTALSASSRTAANSSWNHDNLGAEFFGRLELAMIKRFPKLKLYDSWGIQAQSLEGSILRQVMLQGMEKDIVCLPVHDAVAIPQQHEKWAVDAMLETWERVVSTSKAHAARARVRVDKG